MMRYQTRRYQGTPLAVQADHAAQLIPGTPVIVRDDTGRDHQSVVLQKPFLMGGHTYVVNCEGFHAYSVMRVRLDLEALDWHQDALSEIDAELSTVADRNVRAPQMGGAA
jgi:hypothetical protein